jgi:aconitase A
MPGVISDIAGARVLAILADSVTTDHISPAGSFKPVHPAGKYLQERQVAPVSEFNSYGSRRGNHEVMMRGTFANIRIRNEMLEGVEGGYTLGPDGEQTSIYDAAMAWQDQGVPLVVIAGKEYGTGSSRDWAAKGTMLLGVKAVIAESFERIHRSNLVGMGVIPFEFTGGDNRKTLGFKGDEVISISGLAGDLKPLSEVPATHPLRRRHRGRDRAQVPDRYRDRDRVRRARRRAALRAAQPRPGRLSGRRGCRAASPTCPPSGPPASRSRPGRSPAGCRSCTCPRASAGPSSPRGSG